MPDSTIEALKAGDPLALDRFYREHAEQVLGWAIRLGGPRIDVEDVAQEVFAIALRKIGGFRSEAAVSTWLFAITRNVIANARRKAAIRRWVGLSTLPELPSDDRQTDEQVHLRRRRQQVQQALEQLGTRHREVLVLMDLEGRTAPEVGEMLGVPSGTVYSRLHYARRALATILRREGLGATDAEAGATAAGGTR